MVFALSNPGQIIASDLSFSSPESELADVEFVVVTCLL